MWRRPACRRSAWRGRRAAFTATFADAEFLTEAVRQGFDVRPISRLEMTAMIEEMARTPRPIIERVAALTQRSAGK
jgi:hypothetical protein